MLRFLKSALVLVGLVAVLSFGVHLYAGWRPRTALVEAGMSDRVATCMSKRLGILQLIKLQKLEGDKKTPGAWVRGVKAVNDSQAILVTTSSAALCKTGLAR
jgi:glycerol-3-phosphate dehydrogenase